MPRRYHAYPPEFQLWNILSTAGAVVLAIGYAMPTFYLLYSLVKGKPAPAESVGRQGPRVGDAVAAARRTTSTTTPVVTEPPYNYAK